MKTSPNLILLPAALLFAACQASNHRESAAQPTHVEPARADRAFAAVDAVARDSHGRPLAIATGPLTGSVPSRTSRPLNGNGTTGSIACEFTGTIRPGTNWWVGGPTPPASKWQYNVMPYPATAITGFNKGIQVTVRFIATVANTTPPPATTVTPDPDKTTVLYIKYQ